MCLSPIVSFMKGPASTKIPSKPSNPPSKLPRNGRELLLVVAGKFSTFAAHSCANLATSGENRTLTCELPGTSTKFDVPSVLVAAKSAALFFSQAGSSAPTSSKLFRATGGGLVYNKSSGETPCATAIGAGEMATTPATLSFAATRRAIAPPIECPARIVRSGTIIPRAIRPRTKEIEHSSALAGKWSSGTLRARANPACTRATLYPQTPEPSTS